jgi:dolichol kinase
MVTQVIILFIVLGLLLVLGEYLKHKLRFGNEWSRKLVHILHGIGLASLAFIVPLNTVIVIEAVFLVIVTIGRYTYDHYRKVEVVKDYLGDMYKVGRLSYGEFFFPISVMLSAWIAESNWVFAAAVLVLGIADTVAALVGKAYGKSTSYTILGQKKSLIGSLAFFGVTVIILSLFFAFSGVVTSATAAWIVGISLALTIAENLGVYGSDNFLIPLTAVLALNLLA